MTKYIPLSSILNFIPKGIRQEDTPDNLLSYALEYYRELKFPMQEESAIVVKPIDNHKVQLDDCIKNINVVNYLKSEPTCEEEYGVCDDNNLDCEPCERESAGYETRTNNICNYSLNYKLFLDSPYYNNNFFPLKYVGNTSYNLVCKDCPNRFFNYENNTFSVDKNRILWTSLQSGYLCIDYNTEIKNEDGEYLIVDEPEIKRYLAYASEYEHWRDRISYEVDNKNINREAVVLQRANLYYLKARGVLAKKGFDANMNRAITFTETTNQKLIRIPALYYNQYAEHYNY